MSQLFINRSTWQYIYYSIYKQMCMSQKMYFTILFLNRQMYSSTEDLFRIRKLKFIGYTLFQRNKQQQQSKENTLMKSSDEYRYLSICVSPLSTSHRSTKPREAVALNIPKIPTTRNDNCPYRIVFFHTIHCYWNLRNYWTLGKIHTVIFVFM